MTVITTLMTNSCTVHACDSLITSIDQGGNRVPQEYSRSKIIKIEKYKGAISYFGLARYQNFSTIDWLTDRLIDTKSKTAEEYAQFLCDKLNEEFARLGINGNENFQLGLHFSCYEEVEGVNIPELFFIHNLIPQPDTNPYNFTFSRDTYQSLTNEAYNPSHSSKEYRLAVGNYVNTKGLIWFNNGDPTLFVPAANAIFSAFMNLNRRNYLIQPFGPKECRLMARRPVEIIKAAQRDFCASGKILVGGKIHDISVTPNGVYESSTGDV